MFGMASAKFTGKSPHFFLSKIRCRPSSAILRRSVNHHIDGSAWLPSTIIHQLRMRFPENQGGPGCTSWDPDQIYQRHERADPGCCAHYQVCGCLCTTHLPAATPVSYRMPRTYHTRLSYHVPITLHYITLRYITLHYITLRYITLHYITTRYVTLHYITLHYITLHYITLHYITLHTSICVTYSKPLSYDMPLACPTPVPYRTSLTCHTLSYHTALTPATFSHTIQLWFASELSRTTHVLHATHLSRTIHVLQTPHLSHTTHLLHTKHLSHTTQLLHTKHLSHTTHLVFSYTSIPHIFT